MPYYTEEQLDVINADGNMVCTAVAGSGKSTMLFGYAKHRPKEKGLYIVFNKSSKIEAEHKCEEKGISNLRIETAHSLAWKELKVGKRFKLKKNGYTLTEIIQLCRIEGTDTVTIYAIAKMIQDGLVISCNRIKSKLYASDFDKYDPNLVRKYFPHITKWVQYIIKQFNSGSIPITHDFYLKLFQLSKPKLPYNFFLFDEGQDASPVMLDIFSTQMGSKVIVGDQSQSIYGFKLAVNALSYLDYKRRNLTKSFRFNDTIAKMSNNVLFWKNEIGTYAGTVKVYGVGGSDTEKEKCFISRSNVGLFTMMATEFLENKPAAMFIEGGIKNNNFFSKGSILSDVYSLYSGKPEKVRNIELQGFRDIGQLKEFSEATSDNDLKNMIALITRYKAAVFQVKKDIRQIVTDDRSKSELVFSTVHKAKGQEYDSVVVNNDFVKHKDVQALSLAIGSDMENYGKLSRDVSISQKEFTEEINMLYVAITRTKNKIAFR